jgi:DNA-binding CsgD family transcriptional regulator
VDVVAVDRPPTSPTESATRAPLTGRTREAIVRLVATSRTLFPARTLPTALDTHAALAMLDSLCVEAIQALRVETGHVSGANQSRMTQLAAFCEELWLAADELRSSSRQLVQPSSLPTSITALRHADGVEDLLNRTGPAVELLGISRIGIGFIEGQKWSLRKAFIADDQRLADRVTELSQREPQGLSAPKFEAEVIDRRHGLLVHDIEPYLERTDRRVVRAIDLTSLVVLPLIVDERVIGFLHADLTSIPARQLHPRARVLAEFAETYGLVLENVFHKEAITQFQRRLTMGPLTAFGARSPKQGRILEQLSRREAEVLELISRGYTNERIANELSIATGTVKSHVKHILRKLDAENRASAIALYTK